MRTVPGYMRRLAELSAAERADLREWTAIFCENRAVDDDPSRALFAATFVEMRQLLDRNPGST